MALATYTDLLSVVADYLARDDATARIPDFVTLAEARFNRRLRVLDMMASVSGAFTAAGNISLPSDYIEWVRVSYIDTILYDIRFVEVDSTDWQRQFRPGGPPQIFTVIGGVIFTKPYAAANGYNYDLRYYRTVPPLATNSTNAILTSHPDLYLYVTLAEAYLYLRDADGYAWCMRAIGPEMEGVLFHEDANKMSRRPNRAVEIADRQLAKTDAGL